MVHNSSIEILSALRDFLLLFVYFQFGTEKCFNLSIKDFFSSTLREISHLWVRKCSTVSNSGNLSCYLQLSDTHLFSKTSLIFSPLSDCNICTVESEWSSSIMFLLICVTDSYMISLIHDLFWFYRCLISY